MENNTQTITSAPRKRIEPCKVLVYYFPIQIQHESQFFIKILNEVAQKALTKPIAKQKLHSNTPAPTKISTPKTVTVTETNQIYPLVALQSRESIACVDIEICTQRRNVTVSRTDIIYARCRLLEVNCEPRVDSVGSGTVTV